MPPQDRLDELTAREREVLDLVRLGLTNEEIAGRLGITEAGAKYHVSQILSKLGVSSREEAAAVAIHVAKAFPDGPSGQPRRGRWWGALPLAAKVAGMALVLAAIVGLGMLILPSPGGTEEQSPDAQLPEPTPIPWVDATPAPPPPPPPAPTPDPAVLALRPCNSGDLAALVLQAGALGTTYVPIAIANKSDTPCRLQGMPDVQLLDFSGAAIAVQFRDANCFWTSSQVCILNDPVVLDPGLTELRPDAQPIPGQAVVHLAFSTGAPPACNQDNPYAATVRLGLPEAGGSLDLTLSPNASPPGIEVCYPVGLTQFEDPALVWAPPTASPLVASIEGPARVRRGETVRVLVTLRNISESGLSFDRPCPNYTLHIGGEKLVSEEKLGVLAEHVLNCAPVGVLNPDESVTFEVMATLPSTLPDIPSDASLSLNWSLDRPLANADLQIEIVTG